MRRPGSGQRDRVLAAIEIPALGIWAGALAAFAFVFAPQAFRLVAPLDVGRFATLIAQNVFALTLWGYVLGGVALIAAIARSVPASDRRWDLARAALIIVALALATYQERGIMPAMAAVTDVHGEYYHALHAASTRVYGAVALCVLIALVLAAARRDD
jgi:hypothetical protein